MDSITETPQLVAEELAVNLTEAANNATLKFTPTPEGMICAYSSIMIMALVPILVGSFKSIRHQTETHAKCQETGEQAETMTTKDAVVFPLIASCALFGLYILIKLSPDLVNWFISGYFFLLGLLAIFRLIRPALSKFFPKRFNSIQYTFLFGSKPIEETTISQSSDNNKEESADGNDSNREEERTPSPISRSSESFDTESLPSDIMLFFKFTPSDIPAFILAACLGVWYILTKHWIANNAFGLAFALNGIELLPVNSIQIGCTLLCGLFLYDIFWVFGTDVMVSVARKFDAPIKILFPQDFLVSGFWGKHFAMLGLGDIVIPGIFIAFLLRFDHSLKRKSNVYFWSCFLAYILGLGLTIGVMSYFKHAQPALLYLVPTCILIPLSVALVKGDFKALLAYRDHPLESEAEEGHGDENHKQTHERKSTRNVQTRASSKKEV